MKFYPVLRQIKIVLFLAILSSPLFAQTNSQIRMAEQLIRSGNYNGAMTVLKKLYDDGKASAKLIADLSTCYEESGQFENWKKFLIPLVNQAHQKYPYQIDLGKAYYYCDQTDSAMMVWKNVYQDEPNNMMRYRLVAQAMVRFRLFDEAIEVYRQAMKNIPKLYNFHLDIGGLYRAQLNYEKAADEYIAYLRIIPQQKNYVQTLLINMASDNDALQRLITELEKLNTDNNPDISELLGNLYIRKKDYKNAFKIYSSITSSDIRTTFIYLIRFAQEAEKDNVYDYAIKAYEYILDRMKQDPAAIRLHLAETHYKYALVLNSARQSSEANEQIAKTMQLLDALVAGPINNDQKALWEATEIKGDVYKYYYNDLDKALEMYSKISLGGLNPANADEIRFKLADIYMLKNDLNKAAKLYQSVENKPNAALASYYLAELDFYRGNFSSAKNQYQQLLDQVGMRDSLSNNLLERSFEIGQFASDSLTYARYAAALLLERQNKFSQAAGDFAEIYNQHKAISLKAGFKAAELWEKIDKKNQAKQILENIITQYNGNEQLDYACFLLAGLYADEKQYRDALTLYEKILADYPNGFYTATARTKARELNALIKQNTEP